MTNSTDPHAVPGPLSRRKDVAHVPPHGVAVKVEASAQECADLAKAFGLLDIQRLLGEFDVKPTRRGVHVSGKILADVTQICVLSLDPFVSHIEELVEIDFVESSYRDNLESEGLPAENLPDPIENGHIDLGALTAEFLALGLDPYPHKPGAVFSGKEALQAKDSPFSKLSDLKQKN